MTTPITPQGLPVQPSYYVQHPDDSYSLADPQPSAQAASVPVIAGVGEPLRDAVLGAVARGWCHESTKHLEMDAELAHAITAEVMAALQASRQPQPQQAVGDQA